MNKTVTINLGDGPVEVIGGGDIDLDVEDVRLPDGTRVTNELVNEWAEELEGRGGRPSLDPTGGPSVRLAFRVPEDVSSQVDALAARQGLRRSDVLRAALDQYLASA
ncbi:ribbon-helix-helix protein, CopG family [Cutibacterium avidum]|uniref:ribbon-helix-helix domain-containing protein n=1 Tax=Cutibacterium avidum TaxID=33010 RepID=UPI0007642E4F|nr:ribbon-helix-helix domain-containing protein [Cutibacterium avidum]KXA68276.1 Ribbon-helix-helix protein, CopG family [Cutibacterium avidum]MCO6631224.1 ribbon-helix-helix protein, CopG family [Cutibacterium avidum]MCO6659809.1 ribbon-helix-helix protein, CopG family [Cutibacterium avidum]MCO6664475.1 ribbon-helix-helix protein, CopG family [Cutibacterium avidum]MCT1416579.1 ribbon-helix-helix domain-containing protein [Cutibacterium avidum]